MGVKVATARKSLSGVNSRERGENRNSRASTLATPLILEALTAFRDVLLRGSNRTREVAGFAQPDMPGERDFVPYYDFTPAVDQAYTEGDSPFAFTDLPVNWWETDSEDTSLTGMEFSHEKDARLNWKRYAQQVGDIDDLRSIQKTLAKIDDGELRVPESPLFQTWANSADPPTHLEDGAPAYSNEGRSVNKSTPYRERTKWSGDHPSPIVLAAPSDGFIMNSHGTKNTSPSKSHRSDLLQPKFLEEWTPLLQSPSLASVLSADAAVSTLNSRTPHSGERQEAPSMSALPLSSNLNNVLAQHEGVDSQMHALPTASTPLYENSIAPTQTRLHENPSRNPSSAFEIIRENLLSALMNGDNVFFDILERKLVDDREVGHGTHNSDFVGPQEADELTDHLTETAAAHEWFHMNGKGLGRFFGMGLWDTPSSSSSEPASHSANSGVPTHTTSRSGESSG